MVEVSTHITPCAINDHKRDNTWPIKNGNLAFEVVNCDVCDVDATNNEASGGLGDGGGCNPPKTQEDKLLGNTRSKACLDDKPQLRFIMLLSTTNPIVCDAP